MAIPLATTTITVRRPAADVDPDESNALTVIATGVRARIGSPSGSGRNSGGDQSIVNPALWCDPVDLHHEDTVTDENNGRVYEVQWPQPMNGLGLDHVRAGLQITTGAVRG